MVRAGYLLRVYSGRTLIVVFDFCVAWRASYFTPPMCLCGPLDEPGGGPLAIAPLGINVLPCRSRKSHPGRIRAMRQNQHIILRDARIPSAARASERPADQTAEKGIRKES